ncbi:hypothetical protein ACFCXT_38510 [Streptomyces vinaceus]|uniref:hypothetical protein n=1 Tax=Streptomyces vinaceus TaxID=1960 RepID=UPI0035DDCFD7
MPEVTTSPSDLGEVLWQAWKAVEPPEGYRVEIVEGFIVVSPTGRLSHSVIVNRLRRKLDGFLDRSEFAAHQGTGVIHDRTAWFPDVLVAPEGLEEHGTDDGTGAAIPWGPAKGFSIGADITGSGGAG